jgi:N-acyl-phosphatidylethanolamine-hydrolysing phospholipase D
MMSARQTFCQHAHLLRCTVAILLLGGLVSACKTTEPSVSPERPAHHTADGFKNRFHEAIEKSPWVFIRMKYLGGEEFADQEAEAHRVPIAQPDLPALRQPSGRPKVTWLGHSTFLIQYRGLNILTDPILSSRASPVSFAGPKRLVATPITYEDLPEIHYVIISHNHYDHLDQESVRQLGSGPRYLVPLKLKPWFVDEGIAPTQVDEFDWWDEMQFGPLRVTATPCQHWSARGPFDRNKTLWAAWHLALDDFTVWFGGDTGYNEHEFKEIRARLGPVDLGLIPIGAYAPRWFMRAQHVDPTDAIQLHRDIGARQSIGMHWGTFPLSAEPIMEPALLIRQAQQEGLIAEDEFFTLPIGGSYEIGSGTRKPATLVADKDQPGSVATP